MSYTKQNFISGQILKAEHLNAMETGIEENDLAIAKLNEKTGVLIVNVSEISTFMAAATPTYVADKTFAEIEAAIQAGQYVVANYGSLYSTLSIYDEGLEVMFTNYIPNIVQSVVEINADDTVNVVIQNLGNEV